MAPLQICEASMDLLDKLVGGAGCGPDGAAAARNPLGKLVDQFLDSAQPGNKGELRPPGPPSHGPDAAYMQGLRQGMAESAQMGGGHFLPPPPPQGFMHGPPPPMRQMDPWADEFMRNEHHVPREARPTFRPELEAAFIESERQALHHQQQVQQQQQQHQHQQHQQRFGVQEGQWGREFEQHMMRRHMGPPPPGPAHALRGPEARGLDGAWDEASGPMMMRGAHTGGLEDQWHVAHGRQGQGLEEAWAQGGQQQTGGAHDMAHDEVRGASGEVLRALSNGPQGLMDDKMARSQFVSFMKGLNSGSVEISEAHNTVVPGRAEGPITWDQQSDGNLQGHWDDAGAALDEAWKEAEHGPPPTQANATNVLDGAWAEGLDEGVKRSLEEQWQAATEDGAPDVDLDAIWRAAVEANGGEPSEQNMDEFWDKLQGMASEYDAAQGGAKQGPLENAWEEAGGLESWVRGQGQQGPVHDMYHFATHNAFTDTPDPFAQGMRLFHAGEVCQAILAFEAELSARPENAEAWRMLGTSHAENDEDKRAIACLERAVEHDPYNLPALLSLGVSYVNELDSARALQNLKAWIEHNPKYQGLEIRADEYSDGSLMDEVMQLMLQANDWDVAANGQPEADVQVVLGVVYNVSQDYDSAVEAFEKALQARPDDYSLWNKLGATLANSQRSEGALPAYHKALDIKPQYARAWLNMGISYANLSKYEQAAACYLQALKLNPEASHIWGYLRVTFTAMERFDLVTLATSQDPTAFDTEFGAALAEA